MDPTQQSQMSPMQGYMQTYGERLKSLLAGTTSPGQARMAGPVPVGPRSAEAGGPRGQQSQLGMGPQVAPPGTPTQGSDFKTKWQESTPADQREFTDNLEAQLKKGNQTIDSAYDDLAKQMGTRPEADNKLSREEKGMLLMEFGLNLMANSSGKAYGEDLGGAVGASALTALQGHRTRRTKERETYDERRFGVEKERAGAKSRLAEQGALEERAEARDERRTTRENSQLAGVVTAPDDSVIGYTRGGSASKLSLPGGAPVKAKPKPPPAGGVGGRGFESDKRYSMYMDLYGKDETGAPLTGDRLLQVQKRALAFSADPKSSTFSSAELRTMAEREADQYMRTNWVQFRDKSPAEVAEARTKFAEENFERLKSGEASESAPPPSRIRTPPGGGSALSRPGTPKSFASSNDVERAFNAGEVKSGDIVTINGKRFKVP